jgi:SAM-dependent methyltransferase
MGGTEQLGPARQAARLRFRHEMCYLPPRLMGSPCRICGNSTDNVPLLAREMMFGTRAEFQYFQCASCQCLQIETVPSNIAEHYPPSYYSFSPSGPKGEPAWRRGLKSAALRYRFDGQGALGRLAASLFELPPEIASWLAASAVRPDSRLLDVGSGQGVLLRQLAGWGFTSLTGADPFISADLSYPDGVRVLRRRLSELSGEFDCIMMHHSFEHMDRPQEVLTEARRLLAPGGKVLVRIPLCSSAAYREYGVDWVQLDAPRHFFLHSHKSMSLLAESCGFSVESVFYDSTAFQFWGSEQYRRGIALRAPNSYAESRKRSTFSTQDIAAFAARAQTLNAQEDGDQAGFVLTVADRGLGG